jgi:hypothetical protein
MKKIGFVLVITLVVIGTVFAQNWGNRGGLQSVTVNGTLQLQNGQIVVASGNTIYYCPIIGRYVGFIDGLKEGSNVTVEGFAYGNMLQPTKLTADGKSYDFLANNNGGYDCYASGYNCYGGGNCGGGMMASGFGGRRGGIRGW